MALNLGSHPFVTGRGDKSQAGLGIGRQGAKDGFVSFTLVSAGDGLVSYVSAFRNAFCSKFPRQKGELGQCKMVSWRGITIVQFVKQRAECEMKVEPRIGQGAKTWLNISSKKHKGRA